MAANIYTNESVPVGVAAGLKRRGVSAASALDSGNLGLTDEAQLEYAARKQAIIFTHDADFLRLAVEWAKRKRSH
jgi:predicted nuclease of predicted toxin-antitoxin system